MTTYRVFARTDLADPIAPVGEVEAGNDSAAREAALGVVPDGAVEVTMVPAEDIHWVVRPQEGSEVR